MAYGDSYSAVQAADLQERQAQRDSGQRSLQMLLGVMANRKQQEMQAKQLAINAQATAENLSQAKQEFAFREDLARKRLMADAAQLDFDKSKQTFMEKQAEDNFMLALTESQRIDEGQSRRLKIEESKEARLGRDLDAGLQDAQRQSDLDYQDQVEAFQEMSAVADKKNRKLELEKSMKESEEKNPWYSFSNKEYDSMKLEKDDLDRELSTLASDKRYANVTKWDSKSGKYIPVMTEPKRFSGGGASMDRASRTLFGGSTQPVEEQYSEPAGPPVAQVDPRVPLIKQIMAQRRVSLPEAAMMAEQILNQQASGSNLQNAYRGGNFGSNLFPQ